jgi:hypothetical protein
VLSFFQSEYGLTEEQVAGERRSIKFYSFALLSATKTREKERDSIEMEGAE